MSKVASCADHTPAPTGYVERVEWAAEMAKTHRQVECLACGLWKVWVPKSKPTPSPVSPADGGVS